MASKLNPKLDHQIEELKTAKDEELLEIIGAFALSQEPAHLRASLAISGLLDRDRIREMGREFLDSIGLIIGEALCGPDGIVHHMEQVTVRHLLTVLLPLLGLSQNMIPTAIVAVCVIIVRAGLREYCRGYRARS